MATTLQPQDALVDMLKARTGSLVSEIEGVSRKLLRYTLPNMKARGFNSPIKPIGLVLPPLLGLGPFFLVGFWE